MEISQATPLTEEAMFQMLQKASRTGDEEELHWLLQEDNLLLHRPDIFHSVASPLHIAAAHGHANFVKVILARKPRCAAALDARGFTALHLACANGQLLAVRELLQSSLGLEICRVRDKDGLLPIHAAASAGDVHVLKELLDSCPGDVVCGLTCLGDNILHLAVKSSSFEAVKLLVDMKATDPEFLQSRDANGNTILHLAVARKQLQTLKFLLGKAMIDVNCKNKKGNTVLDVLLESPNERGDLLLGEMIRGAGGVTTETRQALQVELPNEPANTGHTKSKVQKHKSLKRKLFKRFFPTFSFKGPEEFRDVRNTLMIVATLIATVTFQGAMNPPGGLAQYSDAGKPALSPGEDNLKAGEALVDGERGRYFLILDMSALISSLSVILLMICGCPPWKYMIHAAMVMTWMAVYLTGLAFFFAVPIIFPKDKYIRFFFATWVVIMNVFICYKIIRFYNFLYRKISKCVKKKRQSGPGWKCCCFWFVLLPIGISMVVLCLISCAVVVVIVLVVLASFFEGFTRWSG